MLCVSIVSLPSWKNVNAWSSSFSCQEVHYLGKGEEVLFWRLVTAQLLKRLSQTFVHQPLKDVLNVLESGRIGVEVQPTDVIGCLSRTLMSMLQADQ